VVTKEKLEELKKKRDEAWKAYDIYQNAYEEDYDIYQKAYKAYEEAYEEAYDVYRESREAYEDAEKGYENEND